MFVVVLELNDLSFFKQTIIALYLNPCSNDEFDEEKDKVSQIIFHTHNFT